MGELTGKMRVSAKQFVEQGRHYDEIAESNRRAQNIINMKAILRNPVISEKTALTLASMEDYYGGRD